MNEFRRDFAPWMPLVNNFPEILVASAKNRNSVETKIFVMNARRQPPHRLLRQIDTGLYLSADGRWVRHEDEAFDFPDLRSALATCEQMQSTRVEMILVFRSEHDRTAARLNFG